MYYIELLFFVFALAYPIGLWIIARSNQSLIHISQPPTRLAFTKSVHTTIVVVFRDEQPTLEHLADFLLNVVHRYEDVEVIWVNDHSTDCSRQVVESKLVTFPKGSTLLLDCNEEEQGKRSGQVKALCFARYDWLCFIDADCIPSHSEWLNRMHEQTIDDTEKVLISGLVGYTRPKSILQHLVFGESIFLNGIHVSRSRLAGMSLVFGANMLVKRTVFLDYIQSGTNEAGFGGDDVYIAEYVKNRFPNRYNIATSPDALVLHAYPASIRHYLYQRRRWISKWSRIESLQVRFFAACTGYAHVFTLFSPLVLMLSDYGWIWFVFLFFKFATEWAILFYFAKRLSLPVGFVTYLTLSVLYSIVIAVVGILMIRSTVEWKGRVVPST